MSMTTEKSERVQSWASRKLSAYMEKRYPFNIVMGLIALGVAAMVAIGGAFHLPDRGSLVDPFGPAIMYASAVMMVMGMGIAYLTTKKEWPVRETIAGFIAFMFFGSSLGVLAGCFIAGGYDTEEIRTAYIEEHFEFSDVRGVSTADKEFDANPDAPYPDVYQGMKDGEFYEIHLTVDDDGEGAAYEAFKTERVTPDEVGRK